MTAILTITERSVEQEHQRDEQTNSTAAISRPGSSGIACSWLWDVQRQLEAIASLPENWDSYGAASADISRVHAAWGLLRCLCGATEIPEPYVNPTRDGGVQFEWESGDRYFELEVVAERAATYYWRDRAKTEQAEGEVFELEPLDTVIEYIQRVGIA